jgi:hypothetical protein
VALIFRFSAAATLLLPISSGEAAYYKGDKENLVVSLALSDSVVDSDRQRVHHRRFALL